MIEQSRRGFLRGLGAFVACAPAIVSVANIMPVRALDRVFVDGVEMTFDGGFPGYADIVRRAFLPRRYVQVYLGSPLLRGLTPEIYTDA